MYNDLKIVFICGHYGDSQGYLSIERNIAAAREMAAALVRSGYGYYCPHLNSTHFEVITPEIPVEFWYRMDHLIMRGCDALITLPGWETSSGARGDIDEARRLGLIVAHSLSSLDVFMEARFRG